MRRGERNDYEFQSSNVLVYHLTKGYYYFVSSSVILLGSIRTQRYLISLLVKLYLDKY